MAACRESGLTWTSVTSTSTRRGSSNSKPMISYSSSFTASETRNMRRTSIKTLPKLVGRTPLVRGRRPRRPLAPCRMLMPLFQMRDEGVPRGPGGPPHHQRQARRPVLLDPLDGGLDQRRTHQSRSLFLDTAQHLLGILAIARYGHRRDGCPLPEILMRDLRHGDVKLVPQPVFQTLHHVPLLFERMRAFDSQFQGQYADCRHVLRRILRWRPVRSRTPR